MSERAKKKRTRSLIHVHRASSLPSAAAEHLRQYESCASLLLACIREQFADTIWSILVCILKWRRQRNSRKKKSIRVLSLVRKLFADKFPSVFFFQFHFVSYFFILFAIHLSAAGWTTVVVMVDVDRRQWKCTDNDRIMQFNARYLTALDLYASQ